MAAQLEHAARWSVGTTLVCEPVPIVHSVVLAVDNEAALERVETALVLAKISHHAVHEPDREDQLTAIGIMPLADRTTLPREVRRLPLLESLLEPTGERP